MTDKQRDAAGYASPPCFMHELDPSYSGIAPGDAQTAIDVARWRKSQRERLIAERLAIPADARAEAARRIAGRLDAEIGTVEGSVVGIYWPFRGEPDLREWASSVAARGGQLALPVVLEKGRPLEFRTWSPGEKLEKGVWNIPVPAGGVAALPDIVVAPVVGYDEAGFRLGYGGGFYDRILAAMPSRPLTFGVGYALARLQTIYPQWHDIPLDRMVIDEEVNSEG
ncbi:5-formyltetrahydrofolate cyclo-ligase [Mesorhizobium sp. CN2-181]|uniref:5-formyltetrahydrofolate cyclo-ligase n=1 Tax=Mesorhizobium yinganensis TaxID=3157707 RepID=UPI0032B86B3C